MGGSEIWEKRRTVRRMEVGIDQDVFFFFFQAEDGIRDYKVTGVQTCALPIFQLAVRPRAARAKPSTWLPESPMKAAAGRPGRRLKGRKAAHASASARASAKTEIGRASCRERV